jgi:nitrate reductase NapE component
VFPMSPARRWFLSTALAFTIFLLMHYGYVPAYNFIGWLLNSFATPHGSHLSQD